MNTKYGLKFLTHRRLRGENHVDLHILFAFKYNIN